MTINKMKFEKHNVIFLIEERGDGGDADGDGERGQVAVPHLQCQLGNLRHVATESAGLRMPRTFMYSWQLPPFGLTTATDMKL